jgi:hypothetical protein
LGFSAVATDPSAPLRLKVVMASIRSVYLSTAAGNAVLLFTTNGFEGRGFSIVNERGEKTLLIR